MMDVGIGFKCDVIGTKCDVIELTDEDESWEEEVKGFAISNRL